MPFPRFLAPVAIATLLLLDAAPSHAQDLYMPRGVVKAYRNGTRSRDGRPGTKYWQNRARYEITMTALPPDRTVRGTERITYVNNSPDTLRTLAFKLFLNYDGAFA